MYFAMHENFKEKLPIEWNDDFSFRLWPTICLMDYLMQVNHCWTKWISLVHSSFDISVFLLCWRGKRRVWKCIIPLLLKKVRGNIISLRIIPASMRSMKPQIQVSTVQAIARPVSLNIVWSCFSYVLFWTIHAIVLAQRNQHIFVSCSDTGDEYLTRQGIPHETAWDLWSNEFALLLIGGAFLVLTYIQLRRATSVK
jgi:hypothetical protein